METLDKNKRSSIQIELPEPASIIGTIDRADFPNARSIEFANFPHPAHTEVNLPEGQSRFEIHNLPAGQYVLHALSKYKPVPGETGAVRTDVLARELITVEKGEKAPVKFTTADKPIK